MSVFNRIQLMDVVEIEDVVKEDMYDSIKHGIVVSNLAYLLSEELNMNEDFCYKMALSGMLHDIGKLKLSKYLYGRRKDTLKIEEMKYVRMHSRFSSEILEERGYDKDVILAVYHHHENYDGSGYPDNLKEEDIPIGARILRACDVFAALISSRPYRDAFDVSTAMELMIEEVKNFDMRVFLAFQRVVNSEEFQQLQKSINETVEKKEVFKGLGILKEVNA